MTKAIQKILFSIFNCWLRCYNRFGLWQGWSIDFLIDIMNSKLVTYDDEYVFPFCETTTDFLSYDRDYRIVGHHYYYISFSFIVISPNLDRVTVERTMGIYRHRYWNITRIDDTGRYDLIGLHTKESNFTFDFLLKTRSSDMLIEIYDERHDDVVS